MKLYKARPSRVYEIMGGTIGASPSQLQYIAEMDAREKPMTKNMEEKYVIAKEAQANPQPTTGMVTHCQNWYKDQLYGATREVSTKYMEKGLMLEGEAIEFIERYYDLGFIAKNLKTYENEYLKGTPDIVLDDAIRDTKCSWDHQSFPLFSEKLDRTYYWQMQAYMALTDKHIAYVDYVLLNTPEELNDNTSDYTKVADKFRIKTHEVVRDDAAIEMMYSRVKFCRKYINTIKL